MKALVSGELTYFMWSFISGILIAVCYDLIKTIYSDKHFCVAVCNICDAIFVLYATVLMIFVLFSVSSGYVRFYDFLGAFGGAVLYKFTLSPLFSALFSKLFDGIFAVFKFFLKILLTPLEFMYKIMYNTISVLFGSPCRKVTSLWHQIPHLRKLGSNNE